MDLLILATFVVALLSSILSGMSGGGGGFVMTPFFLLIGLSPQQIAANASVAGLGLGSSSLLAMRGQKLLDTKFLWPLAALTLVSTVLAMFVLPQVHGDSFQTVIGFLLIVLAPTLFIRKARFQPGERSRRSIWLGYAAYAAILFASSLGSGVATLLFLPMMFLMGLGALQAGAIRRVLMVMNALIAFCFVLPQGFIVWGYALASLAGCYIGGYIGTKIALRKGDQFVKYALAAVMVASGLALLFS
jgi:uncharacterized membrane protein YfcA